VNLPFEVMQEYMFLSEIKAIQVSEALLNETMFKKSECLHLTLAKINFLEMQKMFI